LKLIIGLGNPGEKYRLTRHNVGFEIIDLLCEEIRAGRMKRQNFSLASEGRLGDEKLILAKPQTFMNLSGVAVSSLSSKYGIPPEEIFVISDDLALDLGLLRVRRGGSAGGHKGVKSIIGCLKNQAFPRLRVGIGQTPQGKDTMNHVLSRFSKQDREQIDQTEQMAVEALKIMILDGIDSAMNKFNIRQKSREESGDR